MSNEKFTVTAPKVANYEAVNCNGEQLGIVERIAILDSQEAAYVILSTHQKDLYGNLQYAVPFNLADIDHKNKQVWLNVEKNEMEFLYGITDLYDKQSLSWNDDIDRYYDVLKFKAPNTTNHNMQY